MSLFSFRVVSLNARSIANPVRRRAILSSLPSVDILCVQETWLSLSLCSSVTFPFPLFFHSPDQIDLADGAARFSAGSAIFISDRLSRLVVSHDVVLSVPARAVAVVLTLSTGDSILIASLYAHSGSRNLERRNFLSSTFSVLAPLVRDTSFSFICGDLNCVRDSDLDFRCNEVATRGHEAQDGGELIDDFLEETGAVDAFRHAHPTSVDHTHVSERRVQRAGDTGPTLFRTLARLDYVFLFPPPDNLQVNHTEIPVAPAHAPDHRAVVVVLTLPLRNPDARTLDLHSFSVWRLSDRILSLPDFKQAVHELALTELDPTRYSDARSLTLWTSFKTWIRGAAKFHGTSHYQSLTRRREDAERVDRDALTALARDPQDMNAYATHMEAVWERRQVAIDEAIVHAKRTRHTLLLEHDESPSAINFLAMQDRMQRVEPIRCLCDNQGAELTDPKLILHTATAFYRELYTAEDCSAYTRRVFLTTIRTKLRPAEAASLARPISVGCVRDALTILGPRPSSPGLDGLPYSFYARFVDNLCPALCRVANEAFKSGAFPPCMMRASISLLPKVKDAEGRKQIGNYRPICLINSDIRLISKVIATRLNIVVGRLINPIQTGFVPGRSISDPVRAIASIVEAFSDTTDSGCAIAFLDQQKAYDRVDHQFLEETLTAFDFPLEFRRMVRALHCGGVLQVRGEHSLGEDIHQTRGLRQGDPSSPLLYNLCLEPLLCTLRRALTPVLGFTVMAFADDVAVVLRTPEDAAMLATQLKLYEDASGAKLNANKTKVLLLGTAANAEAAWRSALPLAQFQNDNLDLKYLGVPILGDVQDRMQPALAKAKTSMDTLSKRLGAATPLARVYASNVFVMSRVLYPWSNIPWSAEGEDIVKAAATSMFNFYKNQQRYSSLNKVYVYRALLDGGLGLLDPELVLRGMAVRQLCLNLAPTSIQSSFSEMFWASLHHLLPRHEFLRRLKPPWFTDDLLARRKYFSSCATVHHWAKAARDLEYLRVQVTDDLDDDGAAIQRLVLPISAHPGARHVPAEQVSTRTLRRRLGGTANYGPIHPASLSWSAHASMPRYEPDRIRPQWRWVHHPMRTPSQRLLHFNIIHGALPVLARLKHTDEYLRQHIATNPALALCPLCAGTEETVYHLFYQCRIAQRLLQEFISIIQHLVPSLTVGGQDVDSLILTKLDSLLTAHRVPEFSRIAINVTQAVVLRTIWDARNASRDNNQCADINRVLRQFSVTLRCSLRTIGRSLPQIMDAWIQPPALFRQCRGVLYFE